MHPPKGDSATKGRLELAFRFAGASLIVLNIAVAALSLGDMYLLASGAVRVDLPKPGDFTWSYDNASFSMVFFGNYSIRNDGFYDISAVEIASTVSTASGVELVSYRSGEPKIPAFSGGRFPIVARMPVVRLLYLDYGSMLFNATRFHVRVRVDAVYELGLARFHADQTLVVPWSPPLDAYARDLLGRNLTEIISGNLTLPPDLGALEAWVLSAMLANGTSVTVHTAGRDVVFWFGDGQLNIEVFDQGSPPVKLEGYTIPVRTPGGRR